MNLKSLPNQPLNVLISAASDGAVLLWDTRKHAAKPVGRFFTKGHATALAVAANTDRIVAGDSLGNIYFLELLRSA